MLANLSYEILRGFAYCRIRHPNSSVYVFWIPIFLTVMSIIFFEALPHKPYLLGKDGFFSSVLSILSTLPGFYFAALAAIATFTNDNIDKEMPEPTPEISIMIKGKIIVNRLTRRQFLSYLFSYLVTLSLLICFLILILNGSVDTISAIKNCILSYSKGGILWNILKILILLPISFIISSMISVTLQGIFFLTERIHQP